MKWTWHYSMLAVEEVRFFCRLRVVLLQLISTQWWRHQIETFPALLVICAGIHRGPVNSPHKGQWREALVFSLICIWINGWVNNREAGDSRRYRTNYDVTVITQWSSRRYRRGWHAPNTFQPNPTPTHPRSTPTPPPLPSYPPTPPHPIANKDRKV